MDNKIQFSMDSEGDVLSISNVDSYIAQECEEISEGVVVRLNPENRKIEMIEIFNFSKRFLNGSFLDLPIVAEFFLAT